VVLLIFGALLSWIPLCLVLFAVLPPRQAVLIGVIGGWVLLPPASIPLSGFPDYDKAMAIVVGVMLGTLIFQPNRLLEFRPRWFDLPALLWCFSPMVSSLSNGLGMYDGMSSMVSALTHWTIPYLIGRLYFADLEGVRELTVGIVIAGLLCALPCLYEIKMSPLLMPQVYGMGGWEGLRLGGYRPRLFFATGLELGMWMTATALTAVWLWKSGSLRRVGQFPFGSLLMPILLGTTVMCRSTGATMLLAAGLFTLWFCTRSRSKALFLALVLLAPTYYAVRIPNLWSGQQLVQLVATAYSKERAGSLAYRLKCEDKLIDKAMEQPLLGWAGWGRSRIIDKYGRDSVATDGMWILILGGFGCVGLAIWTLVMVLPAWLFVRRIPVRQWATPAIGPLTALAMLQALYTVDCLSNGFFNLVYLVSSGGLICAAQSGLGRKSSIRDLGTGGRSASPDRSPPDPYRIEGDPLAVAGLSPDPTNAHGSLPASSQERLADRYRRLARTLKNQGQPAAAKAAWLHAFDLLRSLAATEPDVPEIQRLRWDCANDLAWFLLNEPDPGVADPLLALRLAGEATEAVPECGTYWNTLGAACYRTGDAATAIIALERSMLLADGGNAFDYLFLALAHAQLGHQEQARAWVTRADLWTQQHECAHPELSRLHDEVCASLACGHESWSVS
jgi:tetratricopeptide (TPR) repeat protein